MNEEEREALPLGQAHRHAFVHLRTEEDPYFSNDRVREWRIFDLFFCAGCLDYRRVHVRTEQPHPRELAGRIVTWSRSGATGQVGSQVGGGLPVGGVVGA